MTRHTYDQAVMLNAQIVDLQKRIDEHNVTGEAAIAVGDAPPFVQAQMMRGVSGDAAAKMNAIALESLLREKKKLESQFARL